jgi:hypothetical protein
MELAVLEGLAECGPAARAALPEVRRRWHDDDDPAVRGAALAALRRLAGTGGS